MRHDLDHTVGNALRWAATACDEGLFLLADSIHRLRYHVQSIRDDVEMNIEMALGRHFHVEENEDDG